MSLVINYIKKTNWRLFTADLISGVLLLVFLYTGWSKLREYEQFRFTLSQSYLLKPFAGIIAWLLPVGELVLVLLLFVPVWRRLGLKLSVILLSTLTLYLTFMIIYAPKLPCACGGVLAELSWRQHIFLNLSLIILSIGGVFLYKKEKGKLNKSPPNDKVKTTFQNSILN
jgi:uncharacterized membrane protein YphA (DoxX/SURF4 family)